MITRHARVAVGSYFAFLLSIAASICSANTGVTVGLVLDPPTTAGGGATSTRSGPGTWHLFEVDDTTGHFGILTYNITLTGATAIENRSPLTSILDADNNPQPAGFSFLRTGTNANPIQASEPVITGSPFVIKGMGRDASDFVTQAAAIQPGSAVIGPSISPAWGNYDTIGPYNGKNWLFLAEGTYNSGMPPSVTKASFNIFISPTTYSPTDPATFTNILVSQFTLLVIPEPAGISLVGIALLALASCTRRRSPTAQDRFRGRFQSLR